MVTYPFSSSSTLAWLDPWRCFIIFITGITYPAIPFTEDNGRKLINLIILDKIFLITLKIFIHICMAKLRVRVVEMDTFCNKGLMKIYRVKNESVRTISSVIQ